MGGSSLKSEFHNLIHKDEKILCALLFASNDGFLFYDLTSFKKAWLSSKYWELLGYDSKEKEHMEHDWEDTIYEHDLNMALKELNEHSQDDNYLFDRFLRHKHKDGSTVWMRFRGIIIKDEQGSPIRLLGAYSDVSGYKKMEKKMMRLADEYQDIFNGTQDAMFLMEVLGDSKFRFISSNWAHQKKTKLIIEDFAGKTPEELLGEELGNIVSDNYQKCVISKKSISYEEKLDLPGGELYWMTTLTPIIEDDEVIKIIASATDITEIKKLELELEKQANYDKLTRLPNRRLFFERLERLIVESERDHTQFALLFIDLDGFKDINDKYGHEAGDEVLITVGQRIQKCIRKSDTAARMGGDEYSALLRNPKDKKAISNIVHKIHKALQEVIHIGDHECYVNSSIGIAIYPDNGTDSKTLLRNADSAMYEVKRNGKRGFGFFEDVIIEK